MYNFYMHLITLFVINIFNERCYQNFNLNSQQNIKKKKSLQTNCVRNAHNFLFVYFHYKCTNLVHTQIR